LAALLCGRQALLVSHELIRVAILWHEMWHEGLEEASRQYFGEKNIEAMFATLEPLHAMMEKGPETLREISFHQTFGKDLADAYDWCRKFKKTRNANDMQQAWDLYYTVFRRISKQLPQLTTLEFQYVSPKLLMARNLDLAVPGTRVGRPRRRRIAGALLQQALSPLSAWLASCVARVAGTYRSGEPVVSIAYFVPTMTVITSKQRPRKLTIVGSDGQEYQYLLKGHEDPRQVSRRARQRQRGAAHLCAHRAPSGVCPPPRRAGRTSASCSSLASSTRCSTPTWRRSSATCRSTATRSFRSRPTRA